MSKIKKEVKEKDIEDLLRMNKDITPEAAWRWKIGLDYMLLGNKLQSKPLTKRPKSKLQLTKWNSDIHENDPHPVIHHTKSSSSISSLFRPSS